MIAFCGIAATLEQGCELVKQAKGAEMNLAAEFSPCARMLSAKLSLTAATRRPPLNGESPRTHQRGRATNAAACSKRNLK